MSQANPPELEHIATLTVHVDPAMSIASMAAGQRRIIPITGGEVHGPRLKGRVLPAGADFQIVGEDGVAELDARYALELDDGTRVFVVNRALRSATPEVSARLMAGERVDPSLVYFRCTPRFEVTPGPWSWLMRHIFVGTGVRRPAGVELDFYLVR